MYVLSAARIYKYGPGPHFLAISTNYHFSRIQIRSSIFLSILNLGAYIIYVSVEHQCQAEAIPVAEVVEGVEVAEEEVLVVATMAELHEEGDRDEVHLEPEEAAPAVLTEVEVEEVGEGVARISGGGVGVEPPGRSFSLPIHRQL